ncbi:MAG: acyl-CoA dehydrogenase [Burkholderiales bacterium]|nr:acyl-CoA dehydrogenase [Burkholderiales bacterium]
MTGFLLTLLFLFLVLAYLRAPAWLWSVGAFLVWFAGLAGGFPRSADIALAVVFIALALVLNPGALRRRLIGDPMLALFKRILPAMSQTEREAIDAGTVWWDADLFSGTPDWKRLLAFPKPTLTPEEQSFLDNETERLCALANDWESTQVHQDLSPEAWQFVKDHGFLGMIIPKQYGGKGFSASLHSQVIQKLSTRSSAAAVSVMVPNSLGPAELLMHYGTDEQKNHYLPRLAKGLDIPAFALTNPHAGSDAASIPDVGIVCKGQWQGKEVLGMRLTWDKRYITLGPICTVLGLAFRLRDPEHLLGEEEDLGITCALVPADTPGVNIGRRHFPLNAVFQNGPNSGKDVFMPIDWIIGGPGMAGQGWRMLMECLAAGRSISLPSSNVGMAKVAARATGAYARVRNQFKTAIGKFEGIEEPLARIGGNLYMMDAARMMTAGAVDLGEKPSVPSAIVKYHVTERARIAVNDAMDILGGKGICLGPNNFMGRAYQQIPVAITVEGANILTRSLIIFGQGAIRCHPYVLKEMAATREPDANKASRDFDAALFGHIGFTLSMAVRALVLGLSGARFVRVPAGAETRRHYQKLTRLATDFAMLADFCMLFLGGELKRKEKISARLGDILSLLYLSSCALKRFEDEGRPAEDAPLLHWSVQDALYRARLAMDGLIANFPNKLIATVLWRLVYPIGRPFQHPSDKLGHKVARLLIEPSATRDRLTAGMYLPQSEDDPIGCLEAAMNATMAAEPMDAKIRSAQKSGAIAGDTQDELERAALAAGIITSEEHAHLQRTTRLRDEVIRVDDFPQDFGRAELEQAAAQETAHKAAA